MRATVLVVDDDKEIARAICLLLEKEGYDTIAAYNGMEALDIAMNQEVHLMILDLMMPVMDGMSALMKLRKKKNIPVLILSAKTQDHDKIDGLSAGADDYITKPYNPRELVARVKSHLRRFFGWGIMCTIRRRKKSARADCF